MGDALLLGVQYQRYANHTKREVLHTDNLSSYLRVSLLFLGVSLGRRLYKVVGVVLLGVQQVGVVVHVGFEVGGKGIGDVACTALEKNEIAANIIIAIVIIIIYNNENVVLSTVAPTATQLASALTIG